MYLHNKLYWLGNMHIYIDDDYYSLKAVETTDSFSLLGNFVFIFCAFWSVYFFLIKDPFYLKREVQKLLQHVELVEKDVMKRFQEIKYKVKSTFTPYSNQNQNSPTIEPPAKPTQPVAASSTFPPQPATMPTFFQPELPFTLYTPVCPYTCFPPFPPMFNCPPPPTGFIPSQPTTLYNSVSPQPALLIYMQLFLSL